jgi:photosystem II stability/assembly factor-like uncharacterized protein
MKRVFFKSLAVIIGLFFYAFTNAQQQYTPYDDLPGMIKSYKPAYQNSYPRWGKMLYQYPVNYNAVIKAFNNSSQKDDKALVRYYKLWKRNLLQWVKDDGTVFLPDMNEYYQRLYAVQKNNAVRNSTGDSQWSFLGPKETYWLNEQGSSVPPDACAWQVNVYSFDVAPSNHDIIYAGTETGFMNKTTDKGNTWQLLGCDYYFGGGITAVAVNPVNPDMVYVAAGNQVHKTTDGGTTWTPLLAVGNQFKADRLIIDPQNSDKIFAAANSGLYLSTDGGQSWERKWSRKTYDVAIKPGNSNYVYGITIAGANFRIVESTNGGNTFAEQTTFPNNIYNKSGGLLAVTPANPDKLLAILLSANNTPYLYKETLSTGVWSLLATGNTPAFKMDNGQGYFDLVLDVSPLNENMVLVGTTTSFRSTNGGTSFTAIGGYYGPFSVHPDFQDIKMLDDGDTWMSCDGGMYLTTDDFGSTQNYFALNNGLIGSDMWGFDQGWNEDLVVGGRYHNGNTAIADFYNSKALRMGGAESPTGWIMKGKSRYAAFNDLGNGWILPPTAEDPPEGRFLFTKYPNMDEYGGRRGNMVFHTNYYGTVFLGEGNGFWKSTDMGETFDLLYDFGNRVRYLQISYHNPDVLYADIVNKGLYRTNDGGETWEYKPSLTSGNYGNSNWKGKTFIAISPNDENTVYACLQNGTWSGDIGKIFKSADGGDTWEDWTGTLSEYTKDIVVQPDSAGNDIVYLFTNARYDKTAKVYMRKQGMTDWVLFNNNYPAGFYVNLAMPFYRDAKLRVGGSGGVWESPMSDTNYKPIVNPWVKKEHYNCMSDTLYFDDHSIMKHAGAAWHWDISPDPAYISNADIRNPKVVLGNPGSYTVKLTVTQNGVNYEKEITDMVTTTTCPSIDDCNNPAEVPKDMWHLIYVDSEELGFPGKAIMSYDDDFSTIWHTRWSTGTDPYPHEIQIDMGQPYLIYSFTYYTRQDGPNGRIKDYELYISEDSLNWGEPVSTGTWTNTSAPQKIEFDTAVVGQYFRLVALSEVNGGPWASAAEFSVVGCTDITGTGNCSEKYNDLIAFPVPTSGMFTVSLPAKAGFSYSVYSVSGRLLKKGNILKGNSTFNFDLGSYQTGIYILKLQSETGTVYRVKVVKK